MSIIKNDVLEASENIYKTQKNHFINSIADNISIGLKQADNGDLFTINESKIKLKNKLFT